MPEQLVAKGFGFNTRGYLILNGLLLDQFMGCQKGLQNVFGTKGKSWPCTKTKRLVQENRGRQANLSPFRENKNDFRREENEALDLIEWKLDLQLKLDESS
jgi:hypothetical protein